MSAVQGHDAIRVRCHVTRIRCVKTLCDAVVDASRIRHGRRSSSVNRGLMGMVRSCSGFVVHTMQVCTLVDSRCKVARHLTGGDAWAQNDPVLVVRCRPCTPGPSRPSLASCAPHRALPTSGLGMHSIAEKCSCCACLCVSSGPCSRSCIMRGFRHAGLAAKKENVSDICLPTNSSSSLVMVRPMPACSSWVGALGVALLHVNTRQMNFLPGVCCSAMPRAS